MMNFGGIRQKYAAFENAKVVILPIPYDGTSTWLKGADRGPQALLEASANMELFDIETKSEVYKIGIHTASTDPEFDSPEQMVGVTRNRVQQFLQKEKFVVTIGGEHSVSIGPILVHAENFSDVSILQLDAHADLREEYEGSRFNHACVMARAREAAEIVQVGIRSISEEETVHDERNMFYAHRMQRNPGWKNKALSRLRDKVYITIDLDYFDPSIMPSTGTPEPGGFLWHETLEFLREVFKMKDVVGFDIVELCPNASNKAPDFMAAKLLYQLIGYKYFMK
ncbi:MAG: agmatinase [Bacteroidales bacterium]|nr:agmatinase [Bacteroidales bacterium]MCF8344879.1 agmatinase [Bacteroidales bacterium]MCF8351464.1 agmatinase [Bacteroidales bacterium]MCF8375072.1 agmatinase [Bacteroidales bacterium]MCF8399978.1 agmatinase [Bacteroidales bacterium]